MTAIILQLARLLADGPSKFEGKWEIPVPRDGWQTRVTVSIKLADEELCVSISAFGRHPDDRHGRRRGHAYYPAFFGDALAKSITAEWIDDVLAREIETAMIAARSFRDEDLSGLYRSITSSRSSTTAWPDTSHRPWSSAASETTVRHVRRFSAVNAPYPHDLPGPDALQCCEALGNRREKILDSVRACTHDQNRDSSRRYVLLIRNAFVQRQ
jgi:hypothetical protein